MGPLIAKMEPFPLKSWALPHSNEDIYPSRVARVPFRGTFSSKKESSNRSRGVKIFVTVLTAGSLKPNSGVSASALIPVGSDTLNRYFSVLNGDIIADQANPFNPSTTIVFDNTRSQHLMLKIYDVRGIPTAICTPDRGSAGRAFSARLPRNIPCHCDAASASITLNRRNIRANATRGARCL